MPSEHGQVVTIPESDHTCEELREALIRLLAAGKTVDDCLSSCSYLLADEYQARYGTQILDAHRRFEHAFIRAKEVLNQ